MTEEDAVSILNHFIIFNGKNAIAKDEFTKEKRKNSSGKKGNFVFVRNGCVEIVS